MRSYYKYWLIPVKYRTMTVEEVYNEFSPKQKERLANACTEILQGKKNWFDAMNLYHYSEPKRILCRSIMRLCDLYFRKVNNV